MPKNDFLYHLCGKYVSDITLYDIVAWASYYKFKNKTVKYRQHKYNLIGKNNGFEDIKSRIREFLLGKVKTWSDVNLKNLSNFRYLLTNENNEILENYISARRSKNIFKKLNFYLKSGVFRQSNKESMIFTIGLILNMI